MPVPFAALAGTALRGLATKVAPKLMEAGAKTAVTEGAKAGAKGAATTAATGAGATTAASTVGSTAAKEGAKHGVGVLSPAAKEGAKEAATEGAKQSGVMGHLMDPKNMAMNQVLNMTQMNQMKNQQEKIAHDQKTMESAQRGKEISTGTTTKSDYFGDWVLDEPMLKAWNVLKARMEVGPHDEHQDELFEHLKNLSGQHSIRANEKDNSFILDNVHDDDEDIARRLIESFGRKFADTEAKPEIPESNYF